MVTLRARLAPVAAAALAAGLLVPATGWAAGSSRVKVTGNLAVGSSVSAGRVSKGAKVAWTGCPTALKRSRCPVRARRLGTSPKLTLGPATLGLRVRVTVRKGKRSRSSAWTVPVGAAGSVVSPDGQSPGSGGGGSGGGSGGNPGTKATATSLSVGRHSSCVTMSDTTVRCWGNNGAGLLGNGTADGGARQESAVSVPGLTGITQVSVGASIACALASAGSGTVLCWGTGSPGGALKPTQVKLNLSLADLGVRQVAAAGDFACALTWGGRVWCWGSNDNAQLGRGLVPAPGSNLGPGLVQCLSEKGACTNLTGVVSIALGAEHGCAATSAGELACWGQGDHGQVGLPGFNPFGYLSKANWVRSSDQQYRMKDVAAVQAARKLTCVAFFKPGNAVRCFGRNPLGGDWALSDGVDVYPKSPNLVPSGRLAAGDRYLCSIADDTRVSCSGAGLPQTDPVDGKNLTSDAVSIGTSYDELPSPFVSDSFTCVLTSAGGVRCWGYNLRGEAGGPGQFRAAAGDVAFP